ncbi:hypothetical protein N7468_002462 [Penicillium chermesinum]|uniref:Uncharacterized protein n=1 Tax=Penicillium chermesinum TaxID=63820 RepID=A0A9W9TZL2_9EURO|nr:uncharacterized protein N7468_002462 [Penicillium chermesinum]KAJ5247479.1 hypothetical protein N7468_002462 [Penicillium chermesinum]KAJ6145718.1 hypothetical protein N7470_009613 [Penicillium chermesinum]
MIGWWGTIETVGRSWMVIGRDEWRSQEFINHIDSLLLSPALLHDPQQAAPLALLFNWLESLW